MNSVTTGTLHPHLREEEVLVVENAIRLAIDSIINVLYGVNSARNHEYQRMVGDRDKEIQRLECRLRELERGQQAPRQPLSACGLVLNPDCSRFLVAQVSADPQPAPQHRYDPNSSDPELAKRDCERSDAVAHFERPSLRISFQSDESSLPLSPSRRALRQNGTCRSSESSRTPDAAENAPTSPSSSLVKEEPCDIDKVFIQWEIGQQESEHRQEDGDARETGTAAENQVQEHRDSRSIRTEAHTPPDGCAFPHRQNLRMKRKKSVPMSELSEEAQRLKRAAWRAASRRYYARKVARQQASSEPASLLSQVRDFRCSGVQRTALVQELPGDCPMLQREASAAYCAPPVTHNQAGPSQCARPPQDPGWPDDPLEANGGSHSVSGGIMCS